MKFQRVFIILASTLLLLIGCSGQGQEPLPTPTPHPEISVVDPTFQLGNISRYVYGVNHGPWAFVNSKVYPQAEESGFSFVRFPGGNWGDLNTMTSQEIENMAKLAEDMGAELSISVRLRGGSPEKAAELVRLTNDELGLNIRYWSIGNEPELYGDYDTVRYNQEWRAIAEAMLEVDPDILLIGPDVTQFTGNPDSDPKDENGLYWIDEFLKHNGDLVDIVSIHRYPFPKSLSTTPATIEELYASISEWDTIIPALRSKILEYTSKEIPVAVTEVNSHWSNVVGQQASPDSFANAIWWAAVLSRMIQHEVEIVTYFSLQSNVNIGGYGVFGRYDIRPTYYVYQVYKNMGDKRVYSNSVDEDVSIVASQCGDGDITVLMVNASNQEKNFPLTVYGIDDYLNTTVLLLTKEVWAEEVPITDYSDGTNISLPPESVLSITYSKDEVYCNSFE